METRNSLFAVVFNKVQITLPYKKSWSNGTGYQDHAVTDPELMNLRPHEFAKSTTPSGRRLIIQNTPCGVLVVFDRFIPEDDKGEGILVWNTTKEGRKFWLENHGIEPGSLEREELLKLFQPILETEIKKKFTFYFIDGTRRVGEGETVEAAFSQLEFEDGVLPLMDFYKEGDDRTYSWSINAKTWVRNGVVIDLGG